MTTCLVGRADDRSAQSFRVSALHTTDTLSTVTVGTPLASIVVVMVVYRKAFWPPPRSTPPPALGSAPWSLTVSATRGWPSHPDLPARHGRRTATPWWHSRRASAFHLRWRPARALWGLQVVWSPCRADPAATMAHRRPRCRHGEPQVSAPLTAIRAYLLAGGLPPCTRGRAARGRGQRGRPIADGDRVVLRLAWRRGGGLPPHPPHPPPPFSFLRHSGLSLW
jgi:hypothetical protein